MSTGEKVRDATPAEAMRATADAYDKSAQTLAERYDKADLGKHLSVFLKLVPNAAPNVLDAGCGTGRDLRAMTSVGLQAYGLDLSQQMLELARAGAPRAELVRGDLRHLPFGDETFGGVWSIASVVHLAPADLRGAVAEFARIVVPNGVVFMSVAHGTGSEWRAAPVGRRWFHYYDESEVVDATQRAGLEVVKASTDPGVVRGVWVNVLARKTG